MNNTTQSTSKHEVSQASTDCRSTSRDTKKRFLPVYWDKGAGHNTDGIGRRVKGVYLRCGTVYARWRDPATGSEGWVRSPDGSVKGAEAFLADARRVDFNQATDARLYTEETAPIMARVPWIRHPRLSCDTDGMVPHVLNAVRLLRENGWTYEVFVYILAKNDGIDSALDRIRRLTSADRYVIPFVMPYRDLHSNANPPSRRLRDLARWCNRQTLRKACKFEEYEREMK